jgi:hypothetical protein
MSFPELTYAQPNSEITLLEARAEAAETRTMPEEGPERPRRPWERAGDAGAIQFSLNAFAGPLSKFISGWV